MPDPAANILAKLDAIACEFDDLDRQLVDPAVVSDHERVRSLSIKRAAIESIVERYRSFQSLQKQIADNRQIIESNGSGPGGDPELAAIAQAELPELETKSRELLDQITSDMLTADDRSIGSVMLEVRAGTGGDEAGLWAGDLLQMYQRFAAARGWEFTLLDLSPGDAGGIRSAIANVRGAAVWQGLGYEGGVHSVKRVPATETQGRVHTSTATVAVLPEPEKLQIDIPESDLKIDFTTAQGPGGQNVNKVETAVKMVHVPTGIEVKMQESKSKQQNLARAWQLTRARVYDHYERIKHAERREKRAAMIGSGERSERIRTYRWKENIVVDHRLEQSFSLQKALDGHLEEIVDALIAHDRAQRLAAL